MTLNRDAARALFNSPEPATATAGGSAFATTSPFVGAARSAPTARMSGGSARKAVDWRLAAPLGVAALCAGAALLVVMRRDPAEPGKSVAATEVTRPMSTPLPAPAPMPEPIETAATPPPSIVAPPAAAPAPVVRARAAPPLARRAPAQRSVAVVPSADEARGAVIAREPYVPPPSLGAPVTITPITPPALVPMPEPAPQPVTPQL